MLQYRITVEKIDTVTGRTETTGIVVANQEGSSFGSTGFRAQQQLPPPDGQYQPVYVTPDRLGTWNFVVTLLATIGYTAPR